LYFLANTENISFGCQIFCCRGRTADVSGCYVFWNCTLSAPITCELFSHVLGALGWSSEIQNALRRLLWDLSSEKCYAPNLICPLLDQYSVGFLRDLFWDHYFFVSTHVHSNRLLKVIKCSITSIQMTHSSTCRSTSAMPNLPWLG